MMRLEAGSPATAAGPELPPFRMAARESRTRFAGGDLLELEWHPRHCDASSGRILASKKVTSSLGNVWAWTAEAASRAAENNRSLIARDMPIIIFGEAGVNCATGAGCFGSTGGLSWDSAKCFDGLERRRAA